MKIRNEIVAENRAKKETLEERYVKPILWKDAKKPTKKRLKEYSNRLKEIDKKYILEDCLRESKNFDDFCERCNTLLNKQDALAKDIWDEYQNKYGKQ